MDILAPLLCDVEWSADPDHAKKLTFFADGTGEASICRLIKTCFSWRLS